MRHHVEESQIRQSRRQQSSVHRSHHPVVHPVVQVSGRSDAQQIVQRRECDTVIGQIARDSVVKATKQH